VDATFIIIIIIIIVVVVVVALAACLLKTQLYAIILQVLGLLHCVGADISNIKYVDITVSEFSIVKHDNCQSKLSLLQVSPKTMDSCTLNTLVVLTSCSEIPRVHVVGHVCNLAFC
jgi:hypothetical protein